MQMQEIRNMAKLLGVKTSRLSKVELVRQIQIAEGNFECFATALDGSCDRQDCIWRDDCFTSVKKLKN